MKRKAVDLLEAVRLDIASGAVTAEKCGDPAAFAARYGSILYRKHPTLTYVELSAPTHSGGKYIERGVIPNEFLQWLQHHDVTLSMNANGKHGEVEGKFSDFFEKEIIDYYYVEECELGTPDCLKCCEWEDIRDAFKEWAAKALEDGMTQEELDDYKENYVVEEYDWIDFKTPAEYVKDLEKYRDIWMKERKEEKRK